MSVQPPPAPSQEQASLASASWLRRGGIAAGLLLFNLLLVVPAMGVMAVFFALAVAAIALYLFGIALTASSLAGVSDIVIHAPARHVFLHRHAMVQDVLALQQRRLRIEISQRGLHVSPAPEAANPADADGVIAAVKKTERQGPGSKDTAGGIAIIGGGIVLVLLNMVLIHFSWRGLKRYVAFMLRLVK